MPTRLTFLGDAGITKDVVILHWPEQADRIDDLERLGVPRLLLVEPGTRRRRRAPAASRTGCASRSTTPASGPASSRSPRTPAAIRSCPTLDEHGQLSHRGESVFLSLTDQRIAEVLVEQLRPGRERGNAARPRPARRSQRPDPAGATSRGCGAASRRSGLAITCVRGHGYLHAAGRSGTSPRSEPFDSPSAMMLR